jgi:hypothetical protein
VNSARRHESTSFGFGNVGASVALRFVAGVVEGGSRNAGATAAGTVAGDVGAASDAAEEPGACGVASAGTAFSGDGFIRQARPAVAGGSETTSAGARIGGRVLAFAGWVQRRNSKAKPPTAT